MRQWCSAVEPRGGGENVQRVGRYICMYVCMYVCVCVCVCVCPSWVSCIIMEGPVVRAVLDEQIPSPVACAGPVGGSCCVHLPPSFLDKHLIIPSSVGSFLRTAVFGGGWRCDWCPQRERERIRQRGAKVLSGSLDLSK